MQNQTLVSSYLTELTKFGGVGKVHSIFDHSFNISFGDQLVNVTEATACLSSFGLRITEENFHRIHAVIKKGELLKFTGTKLVLYSRKSIETISLAPFQVENLAFEAVSYNKERLAQFIYFLSRLQLEEQLGIACTEKEHHYFQQMEENKINIEAVLHFIGRGKGLTPSGDDLLLGYLYLLKLYEQPQAAVLQKQIQQFIHKTTIISENYFFALSDGYVSSVLMDVARCIETDTSLAALPHVIKALLAIGHTSGADMCYGILLGARAVQFSKEDSRKNQ